MDFKAWLAKEMAERDLNNIGLALKIGVSDTMVGYWLRGRSKPGIESCNKLAQFFHVPPQTVLETAGYLPSADPTKTEEREIIFLLRQLPAIIRDGVKLMLRGYIEQQRRQRKAMAESFGPDYEAEDTETLVQLLQAINGVSGQEREDIIHNLRDQICPFDLDEEQAKGTAEDLEELVEVWNRTPSNLRHGIVMRLRDEVERAIHCYEDGTTE